MCTLNSVRIEYVGLYFEYMLTVAVMVYNDMKTKGNRNEMFFSLYKSQYKKVLSSLILVYQTPSQPVVFAIQKFYCTCYMELTHMADRSTSGSAEIDIGSFLAA